MKNKIYTEEDLRKLVEKIDDSYREVTRDNSNGWEILEDFLKNGFKDEVEEEKDIPVTFFQIKNNIGWSEWCDVTGGNHYALNEGYSPSDSEIFYCTRSQAIKLGIIKE